MTAIAGAMESFPDPACSPACIVPAQDCEAVTGLIFNVRAMAWNSRSLRRRPCPGLGRQLDRAPTVATRLRRTLDGTCTAALAGTHDGHDQCVSPARAAESGFTGSLSAIPFSGLPRDWRHFSVHLRVDWENLARTHASRNIWGEPCRAATGAGALPTANASFRLGTAKVLGRIAQSCG